MIKRSSMRGIRCAYCNSDQVEFMGEPGEIQLCDLGTAIPHWKMCKVLQTSHPENPEAWSSINFIVNDGGSVVKRMKAKRPELDILLDSTRDAAGLVGCDFKANKNPRRLRELIREKEREMRMARTMYDSHHDKNNVATPIFMLEDSHLENIIRVKAANFAKYRTKFSDSPKSEDPMIAALGRTEVWSPEKLQAATKTILEDLHPYLAEALVRGSSSLISQATESMQLIAKRTGKFEVPQEALMLDTEEDPDEVFPQEGF